MNINTETQRLMRAWEDINDPCYLNGEVDPDDTPRISQEMIRLAREVINADDADMNAWGRIQREGYTKALMAEIECHRADRLTSSLALAVAVLENV